MWIDETIPVCCRTEVPELRGKQLYRLREGAQLCCHLLWQMRLPGTACGCRIPTVRLYTRSGPKS